MSYNCWRIIFCGTYLREIVKHVSISQGHLHYYFPSKDLLFLAVLDYIHDFFVTYNKQFYDDSLDPQSKLKIVLEKQKDLILNHSNILSVQLDSCVHASTNVEMQKKFKRCI
jgi:AcrR family transcriptional regulator